jgi:hypothetical protein
VAAALILKGLSPGAALVFLITDPGDFRYGPLLDIYEGGFVKHGFQAKHIDDPWMAHETCGPAALCQALDFMEQGRTH